MTFRISTPEVGEVEEVGGVMEEGEEKIGGKTRR